MEDKIDSKEIEEFIKSNNIKTRSELQNNYLSVCQKFWKLPEEEKDRILPRMYDYSYLQDKNDFANFIQVNKIESRNQFDETYPGIYSRFKLLLTEEEQNEILPPKVPSYKNLITAEDFDKFISENHIKSRRDFGNRFYGAYMRFLSLPKEEQDKITFEIDITMHHVDWVLNNVDDFKKFIKDKKVKSKKDLQKNYSWAYHRFYSILTEEERNSITFDSGNRNLKNINSISDFQKFIDEEKIESYTKFTEEYRGVYKKFCAVIGSKEKDKLKFPPPIPKASNNSSGEEFLIRLFNFNQIKFEQQKEYKDLTGHSKIRKRCLRFDFFLPDYNAIIEYHGGQHFDESTYYYSDDLIFNDKKKYFYCVCNKIPILYFTLNKKLYEKFGYFTEVITDPKILINKIKEIGMTNQPQQ